MLRTLPSPARLERIETLAFADLFAAAPTEVSSFLGLGSRWLEGTLLTWASRADVLMFNRAFGIGQPAPATAAHVKTIASRFDAEAVPRSFLQIAPGAQPALLEAWAGELGYAPYNRWAKFARALVELPPVADAVHIEKIGPARAAEFGRLVIETFTMPEQILGWHGALVGRTGWHHYVATLDGEAVGCAAMFVCDGLASFGTAGTVTHARGRGVQGALITRRLHDAAAAGCSHAVVETAEDTPAKPAPSFRNQLRHGFELCYMRANWLRAMPPRPA